MKILKGKYENGQVKLTEPAPEPGPVDVEVVFLDRDDRRWDEIIRDSRSRRLFALRPIKCLRIIRQGKHRLWTLRNSEQSNPPSLLGALP